VEIGFKGEGFKDLLLVEGVRCNRALPAARRVRLHEHLLFLFLLFLLLFVL